MKKLRSREGFDQDLGEGWVRIYWFVEGPGTFESAPFALMPSDWGRDQDFLSSFTTPSEVGTGEPINWARLRVADKLWRRGRGDKGGFIQEALGWKPAALQPAMYLPSLAKAAGVPFG